MRSRIRKTRIERLRILVSQIGVALLGILAVGTESVWKHSELVEQSCFGLALVLVTTACLGRIWCLAYIAGRKERELVTDGPYSICRNPLYLFSFLGILGVALATNTVTFPLTVTMGFLALYPFVIGAEERRLTRLHGMRYDIYRQQTPRFIPAFHRYRSARKLEIEASTFHKGLLDTVWFSLALMGMHIVMELHEGSHLLAFAKVI